MDINQEIAPNEASLAKYFVEWDLLLTEDKVCKCNIYLQKKS